MKRFSPPTEPEVLLYASKIGLPDIEASKFFNYYSSREWTQGRYSTPIRVWKMCMANWKIKWTECQAHSPELSGMDKLIRLKELERVESAMKKIADYYGKTPWEELDRQKYKSLKARQAELTRLLGLAV